MKLRNIILLTLHLSFLSSALLALSGCSDKEDTTPSLADKDRLEGLIDTSLPKVRDIRDQYGTYILYNFDQQLDFAYQFEQATNWQDATLERLDRNGASEAVDYLCENFLNCYSDGFKQQFLPRRLMLVKSLKAKTLGISEPDAMGYHQAAANIGGMTIAFDREKMEAMTGDDRQAYLRQLHTILLAGYLINVRAEYPVGESYLSFSQSYYSSLMDEKRVQARRLPDEFFLNRGFFRPADDESTYFVSAEEDMIEFTRRLLQMDEQMQDSLADYPLMENKLAVIANGLHDMGVDVAAINPLSRYYLEMGEAVTLPSLLAQTVITPTSEADFPFTILRGSRPLGRVEVWVNGQLQHNIELTEQSESARISQSVRLTGLTQDQNPVELRLYEAGRPRPSAIQTVVAYHVSKVMRMVIRNSLGETYTLSTYDYDYTDDSNRGNVSTIRFRKSPTEVDMNTGVETGGDHRFWVVYRENGLVTRIVVKQEEVDYVNNKNSYEPRYTYEFQYNEKNELTGVTRDGRPIVTDTRYAGGLLTGYSYEGRPYTPVYDTSVSPAVRVDCLDAALSGHCFSLKGDEAPNYYYQPDIPAVIPGTEAGIPLQILYSKYLFTRLGDVWTNRWVLEGNAHYTEVTLGEVTWTFNFVLI